MLSLKILKARSCCKLLATQFQSFSSQVDLEWESAKPYDEIPGPKGAFELIRLMGPGGKLRNLPLNELVSAFKEIYGPLTRFPGFLGQKPMVITFLPKDIEKVFRNNGKFPNRRALETVDYFRKKVRPDLYPAGAGLTTTQGEEWYEFRSKVQQILMQPRATKVYIPGIDTVACDLVDKIRKIRDKNNETPADFLTTLNEWSLESIGLIALDTRLGILDDPNKTKMNRLIKHIFQATYDYDIQPSIWRYFKTPGFKKIMKLYEETAEEIKKHVMEAVERFEKNPSPDDHERGVLEKLIQIDKNIGIAMAEDMLLAGVDTTSSAMVAVLYNLAQNPDKQEILRQEILRILPERDSKLSSSSFNEVPYLRAVIKESLRLKPVVNGNMRQMDHDIVLQGYRIPKGIDILLNNSYLSLHEDQFKKSKEFIPERWLKDNIDPQCPHAKDAHSFSYLPFGFGSRMCVGRRFAELEIEVLTSRLIREFKLEWHHPEIQFKIITINIPDGPLKIQMKDYE